MKTRIGLESLIDKDKLKKLVKGNVLWSVQYDSDTNTVSTLPLIFQEYVKAPGNKEGVWGRVSEAMENDKGEFFIIKEKVGEEEKELTHVTDMSIGIFFEKEIAIKMFRAEFEKIVDACNKALDLLKEKK